MPINLLMELTQVVRVGSDFLVRLGRVLAKQNPLSLSASSKMAGVTGGAMRITQPVANGSK